MVSFKHHETWFFFVFRNVLLLIFPIFYLATLGKLGSEVKMVRNLRHKGYNYEDMRKIMFANKKYHLL